MGEQIDTTSTLGSQRGELVVELLSVGLIADTELASNDRHRAVQAYDLEATPSGRKNVRQQGSDTVYQTISTL